LRGFAEAAAARRAAAYIPAPNADWTRAGALEAAAVDDVAGLDEPGQIALFDLCNRLRACDGALAAAGDAPPAQLALRPDLRSRLASGIVLQLRPLDDAEKTAALRERAAARGMSLADELLHHLLTRFDRDMGTQIALLDALDRASLERKRPITLLLLEECARPPRAGSEQLMRSETQIALFDLDNTLLSGDSDYEWAQYLIERGILECKAYEAKNEMFFGQYKAGRLDIHEFLDFQLAPLALYPREKLEDWHREFMRLGAAHDPTKD
jgi:DnaA regulatory inactivator Hda